MFTFSQLWRQESAMQQIIFRHTRSPVSAIFAAVFSFISMYVIDAGYLVEAQQVVYFTMGQCTAFAFQQNGAVF
jgi:hypothetical protein